jgi:hypothetical protein
MARGHIPLIIETAIPAIAKTAIRNDVTDDEEAAGLAATGLLIFLGTLLMISIHLLSTGLMPVFS